MSETPTPIKVTITNTDIITNITPNISEDFWSNLIFPFPDSTPSLYNLAITVALPKVFGTVQLNVPEAEVNVSVQTAVPNESSLIITNCIAEGLPLGITNWLVTILEVSLYPNVKFKSSPVS